MVTSLGVVTDAGAVQVTFGPLPSNVPTGADHFNCNWSTGVSSSCTFAATSIVSARSAKFAGSLGRRPCTVMESITGRLLAGGGGGGWVGPAGELPHAPSTSVTATATAVATAIRIR